MSGAKKIFLIVVVILLIITGSAFWFISRECNILKLGGFAPVGSIDPKTGAIVPREKTVLDKVLDIFCPLLIS